MTTEEKTLLTMLTVAAVLVPVALGAALGWPAWSWPLLAVPLLGAPGLMYRIIRRRGPCELVLLPYDAPSGQIEQRDPARQIPVSSTLQSAVADYGFHFSATVYWRPTRGSKMQHADPGAFAKNAIRDRAQTITEVEQPDKVDVVQYRLASVLGAVRPDADSGVEIWADNVQLALSEADQERLRKLSDGRKDRSLWEYEHSHERRKRDYLSNDVLKSTGSAVTWCLTQKDNDVEGTVRLIGPLAQLSAAANDKEVDQLYRHLVPDPALPVQLPFESLNGDQQLPNGSFHDGNRRAGFSWAGPPVGPLSDFSLFARLWGTMMDMLDFRDGQRALFEHSVVRLIEKFGKTDEAQEIRRHFDAPVTNKKPADPPESDGGLPDRPAPDVEPPLQEESWRSSPLAGEPEQNGQSSVDEQLPSEQLGEPSD
jgi:hypothetical protein